MLIREHEVPLVHGMLTPTEPGILPVGFNLEHSCPRQ